MQRPERITKEEERRSILIVDERVLQQKHNERNMENRMMQGWIINISRMGRQRMKGKRRENKRQVDRK